MRWIGAICQLAIFITGGLCFLSIDQQSWVFAGIFALLGYLAWLAMNIEIVAYIDEEEDE